MRLKLLVVVMFIAVAVYAQDASMQLNDVDINPEHAEVFVLQDGGCNVVAYATIQFPSIEPNYSKSQYAFNGARCTTVKNAILTAAKRDMRNAGVLIGDGGVP